MELHHLVKETQFGAVLFCQLGRADLLREITIRRFGAVRGS
jgi:hypothetical protein